jgi:tRNA nucleotidyltransferase (CCA-adding enzyme)
MTLEIDKIVKKIVQKHQLSKEEISNIDKEIENFKKEILKIFKKKKISADFFVGGSYAKGTLFKKEKYDIDIYFRFEENHNEEELSSLTEDILKNFENISKVKGSRDYFQLKINSKLYFEIVPVRKVKTPKEAKNITDLSYSHVNYFKKKATKKILEEAIATKIFCQAKNCYGAKSYIKGFSGYALELLILKYGSFEKFLKEISKISEKLIIDLEKQHKDKKTILLDLNEAKISSPIILIDPTDKYRNVVAALSEKTLEKFKLAAKKFLKSPKIEEFEKEPTDLQKVKEMAERKGEECLFLEAKTNKPEGSVAGSKLLKFSEHLSKELSEFFLIKKKGFDYNGKQSARFFVSGKKKKEKIYFGPKLEDEKNVSLFKNKHRGIYVSGGRLFAKERITGNIKEFFINWVKNNKKRIKEMYITGLKILN